MLLIVTRPYTPRSAGPYIQDTYKAWHAISFAAHSKQTANSETRHTLGKRTPLALLPLCRGQIQFPTVLGWMVRPVCFNQWEYLSDSKKLFIASCFLPEIILRWQSSLRWVPLEKKVFAYNIADGSCRRPPMDNPRETTCKSILNQVWTYYLKH